jgi:hypothetical protein
MTNSDERFFSLSDRNCGVASVDFWRRTILTTTSTYVAENSSA